MIKTVRVVRPELIGFHQAVVENVVLQRHFQAFLAMLVVTQQGFRMIVIQDTIVKEAFGAVLFGDVVLAKFAHAVPHDTLLAAMDTQSRFSVQNVRHAISVSFSKAAAPPFVKTQWFGIVEYSRDAKVDLAKQCVDVFGIAIQRKGSPSVVIVNGTDHIDVIERRQKVPYSTQ